VDVHGWCYGLAVCCVCHCCCCHWIWFAILET
jgi:hypothetical protein